MNSRKPRKDKKNAPLPLPGYETVELPPDSSIIGSNFYSVAESALLAWMSSHCTREFGPKFPRITNFDTGTCVASSVVAYAGRALLSAH